MAGLPLPRWLNRGARHLAAGLLALGLALGLALVPAQAADPAATGSPPRALRVAGDYNYPPFLFIDPSGQPAGYVLDYWRLWSKKTGIPVDLQPLEWAEAQRRIQHGEADVIDLIFRTPQREPLYDFTAPYADVPVAIYRHRSIAGVRDVKALRGFQIGVMAGDACIDMLRLEGIGNLREYRNYAELIAGALAEDVKLFCLDEHPANYYLYRQSAQQTFIKAFDLYTGHFRRAVRKGDRATLDRVQRGMAAISAEEDAALREKWMPTPAADYAAYARYFGIGTAVTAVLALMLVIWGAVLRTAVKRQTRELKDSEERFRVLFEDTQQALTLIEDGRFVAANRASLAMLRMDRLEQLLGRSPVDISPPFQPDGQDSAAKARAVIEAASARGSLQFEWTHLRNDGEEFIAQVLLTAMRQGDKLLLHVVWTDITAQKQAERELAEYRQDLEHKVAARTADLAELAAALRAASGEQQAILESASSGIVLLKDRVAVRCNRRMHDILGWPEGGLVGQSTRLWYVDEAAYQVAGGEAYAQVWRGETHRREQIMRRRDGSEVWTRMTGHAVDPGDRSKGSVWVIDDITAERAALEELRRAQAQAEQAARAKADFLANMSHEIRTPMNAIMGMTHLVLNTETTPRQRDYLEKIQRSSQHLLGIINDILDYSKIDSGKMTLERTEFDLEKVLQDTAALLGERASAKNLELILEVAPTVPPRLLGDPLRIGQVLINFGNNAVKFTERGEIAIRVSLTERRDGDLLLRFEVSDTGIGLSEAQSGQLFQSFHQADTSTTRKYGGTGLGLAICKRLAELMGGEVGVCSSPGQGATFWFTARLQAASTAPRPLLPSPDLRGLPVLVVDDNGHARSAIEAMLRAMSFQVGSADSGAAALTELARAAAEGQPHRIVFLDWRMPDMDGLATARALRQLDVQPPPHLILIAPQGRDETPAAALELGIEQILCKPLTPSTLFDACVSALGQTVPGADAELPGALPAGPRPGVAAGALAGSGARVLLVEDNALNQEVASRLLEELGLAHAIAADGQAALDKLAAEPFDLVLMDMQMPVMDGLTATRRIREQAAFRDLPVLAMTANVLDSDRDRCLDAGMNDHIAKPIDPDDLAAKLARWLGLDPRLALPARDDRHDALADLPGLDTRAGLGHALGKPALYQSLLAQFVRDEAAFSQRLGAALDAGDWALAERQAHTLKGAARQIGARDLPDLAEALERAVHDRADEARLNALRSELGPRLAELIGVLESRLTPDAPARLDLDPDQVSGICRQLARQLESGDFACGRLVRDNTPLLQAALGDHFAWIDSAIAELNYDAALDWLKEAAAERGITL